MERNDEWPDVSEMKVFKKNKKRIRIMDYSK